MKLILTLILSLNFTTIKKIATRYGYTYVGKATLGTAEEVVTCYFWYNPSTQDSLAVGVNSATRELEVLVFAALYEKCTQEFYDRVARLGFDLVRAEYGEGVAAWWALAVMDAEEKRTEEKSYFNDLVIITRVWVERGVWRWASGFKRVK